MSEGGEDETDTGSSSQGDSEHGLDDEQEGVSRAADVQVQLLVFSAFAAVLPCDTPLCCLMQHQQMAYQLPESHALPCTPVEVVDASTSL